MRSLSSATAIFGVETRQGVQDGLGIILGLTTFIGDPAHIACFDSALKT